MAAFFFDLRQVLFAKHSHFHEICFECVQTVLAHIMANMRPD